MMVRPDGQGVETPIMRAKPRGEVLSDDQIRILRDLCFSMLATLDLSPADARRVMTCRITDRAVRLRQKELAPRVNRDGVFPLMRQVAKGVSDAG